jgi:hypothetical protein
VVGRWGLFDQGLYVEHADRRAELSTHGEAVVHQGQAKCPRLACGKERVIRELEIAGESVADRGFVVRLFVPTTCRGWGWDLGGRLGNLLAAGDRGGRRGPPGRLGYPQAGVFTGL